MTLCFKAAVNMEVKHAFNLDKLQLCVKLLLKTYAAFSNAHLSRVCKRGKLSGSRLSTFNGFGSTQLRNQTTYTITLVTNTIVAESILFVWLFRAAHDLTSWPSG